MSVYRPERLWPRLVPKGSIMVSLFAGTAEQAFGVIGNISGGGACVVSAVHFEPGQNVLLRIGFEPEGNPFSTQGEVVWSRDESEGDSRNTFIHGVRFLFNDEAHRKELRNILERPEFVPPVIPGMEEPPHGGLDAMMNDLSDELSDLGNKVQGQVDGKD